MLENHWPNPDPAGHVYGPSRSRRLAPSKKHSASAHQKCAQMETGNDRIRSMG